MMRELPRGARELVHCNIGGRRNRCLVIAQWLCVIGASAL
jgi:hypothetical protein